MTHNPRSKTPAESPKSDKSDQTRGAAPVPGSLVPQPHGGALRHGSQPGGPAGPGRPPSELRELMRKSLEERLPILERIADDPGADPADRIKAIELLARYGLGTSTETKIESSSLSVTADATAAVAASALRDPGVRAFLERNPDIQERLRSTLPPEQRARYLPAMPADVEAEEEEP